MITVDVITVLSISHEEIETVIYQRNNYRDNVAR